MRAKLMILLLLTVPMLGAGGGVPGWGGVGEVGVTGAVGVVVTGIGVGDATGGVKLLPPENPAWSV